MGNFALKCFRFHEEVYLRHDVEKFFSNYILKDLAYKNIRKSTTRVIITNYYKRLDIKDVVLGDESDIYISICDYDKLNLICSSVKYQSVNAITKIYADILGYITLREVKDILKLSYARVQMLIVSKELVLADVHTGTKLFRKTHIEEVYKEQMRLLIECKRNYYTSSEVKEKYGGSFEKYISSSEEKIRRPIEKREVPNMLIGNINYRSRMFYNKTQVDGLWIDYKLYNEMNSLFLKDPFDNFVYKVEQVLLVKYEKCQEKTKSLWYEYVKKYLSLTRIADESRILVLSHQFAKNTKVIFNIFKKEIYSYNANEINKLYMNSTKEINRTYQRDFYNFLKQMLDSFIVSGLPIPFNINEITDPKTYKSYKETDESIYSLTEYHALFEYLNRVDFHKEKAITNVKHFLEKMDISKYKHYDSCWLYVIIHLTNNWRHGTVISQIPRIDLSDTKIKSLDWLMENNPSLEDANNIIFQIGRFVTKINKSGVAAESIFTIGEPLKIAFATAISICEFRTQSYWDNSLTLIELIGKLKPKYNPHKEFFREFNADFKFENRKMNRTLATLIWSVLRHFGKGLKEAQLSRSHLQDQTTCDHYIKLSDEQVKHLVLELFERNEFGFVTQSLTNILFGRETNKEIETGRIVAINRYFGDVIKIEATAGLINRLAIEKEQVTKYLKEFNIEELHKLYYRSLGGVLPSKQKYYQCIYAKCKFQNEFGESPQCDVCVSAIINVYALANIMDNYIYFMEKIVKEFDSATLGEKQKLANHFHLINSSVELAREKFGVEVVNGFVKGKTEHIKVLGAQLSSKKLKRYRTQNIFGGEVN